MTVVRNGKRELLSNVEELALKRGVSVNFLYEGRGTYVRHPNGRVRMSKKERRALRKG
jgi:hypothetical protein